MPTESPSLTLPSGFVRATCEGSATNAQPAIRTWRQAFKEAVRSSTELHRILKLDNALHGDTSLVEVGFPVFAPHEFIARMMPGDPADPLLRQVLATAEEAIDTTGFLTDPVGDDAASPIPGLIRKYQSRALLIVTGACAIHCRYCFRRHFPYDTAPRSLEDWQPALKTIAADPEIDEVILSGGDPLTVVDETLAQLAQHIAQIDHVQRLRIHTRLPIVIPQRVTNELLAWLRGTRLAPIVVVHANHPQEIDDATSQSLTRFVDAGIPVLNQAVLLRGVNDSVATQVQLNRKLVNLRVMPYYLHQLDRVQGAAHFEVPAPKGLEIIEAMRAELPGYAIPRFAQEVPGDPSKRILG